MELHKYKWAALVAVLLIPTIALANAKKTRKTNTALKNLKAFLLMIQYAEGTIGVNAYRKLFGGGLFSNYSQHPNLAITKYGITSTAAGAYQFLYSTWTTLQQDLQLPDFSPSSQDKAAITVIKSKGALTDVLTGKIVQAIEKCRKIWASFPGAGYGQNEKSLADLLIVYSKAGGTITVS